MTKRTNAFWFFVAFIGGGVAVGVAKLTATSPWFAAIVAAGVVLALMAYYMSNDADEPEEAGDNVYYLGLLFTLLSLMFALVELFGTDTDATANAEKIHTLLRSFGIALTSTVAGIAGRIMLQNRKTAGPTPPTNHCALKNFDRHLLQKIARELTQSADALARFHRTVQRYASHSEEHLRNHSETLKRESTEFQETLQRNTDTFYQDLNSQIKSTLHAVENSFNSIAQKAEAFIEHLQSVHDSHITETRNTTQLFAEEMQSMSRSSLDTLQQNFDELAQRAKAMPEHFQSVHDRHITETRNTTQLFAEEMQSMSRSSLDTLQQNFDEVAQRAKAMPEHFQSTHDRHLSEFHAATKLLHDEVQSVNNQNLNVLQQNFDAIAQQSLSLVENLSLVNEMLSETFGSLKSGLEGANDASTALGNNTNQVAKSAASLVTEVDKLRSILPPLHAGLTAAISLLNVLEEIDTRIRADQGSEQVVTTIREIGSTLRTISDAATVSTSHATSAAEEINTLAESIQATDGQIRHAMKALGALSSEVEKRIKILRRSKRWSLSRFWNRSR